jgi:lipid-A-disaccharide synthase
MNRKTIYFVAGEASADNHGAALMRALQNLDIGLNFIGRGGPQMRAIAGERFENWIDKSGVLGLWEVIKHYGYFRRQFRATLRDIEDSRPDAIVLIDYPGFNLRLARALYRHRITCKLIYYISPQVWAWNRSRIKKMARWLDLMLCIFPFETELYNQSGLRAIFVGHPMIETLRTRKIDGENDIKRDPNLIGLFPGSRSREVRKIFPVLVQTARELRKEKPNLRFEIAAGSAELAREIRQIINATTPHLLPMLRRGATSSLIREEAEVKQSQATSGAGPLLASTIGKGRVEEGSQTEDREFLKISVGQTAAIMRRAFVGIVASGSATLEAAYFRLPFVLVYKVSWMTYLVGRLVVRVKCLGMPNVLANKEIAPEFIQHNARPHKLTKAILGLLDDRAMREKMLSDFDAIIRSLGQGGASDNAARAILEEIRG